MKQFFLAGIAALFISGPVSAQSCETMNVLDPSGAIVSSSLICVDANGNWAPPQPVMPLEAPAVQVMDPEPALAPIAQQYIVTTAEPAHSQTPARHANRWAATSGSAKRREVYAKLGLVCVAKKAMFCGATPCGGRCEGKQGWCDGKTGEVYASLDAMERAYCRPKRR